MLELRVYVYVKRREVCAAREPGNRSDSPPKKNLLSVLIGVRASKVALPPDMLALM